MLLSSPSQKPQDETQQFADLIDCFQKIAEASHPARQSDLLEEARDLHERFQSLWQPYLEENAQTPPSINAWDVAGLGHDEVNNCRVLKWFLDPNESHCQGTRLLRCLFEVMGEQWIDEADTTWVRREVSEGDSRFDIVIESRSVFACIEVKIRAQESREQLVRYFERVGKKVRGRRFIGRLLTADGKSGQPVVERFTRLLWSDVACALRRFAGAEYGSDPLIARSLLIRELASQYADFITSHFLNRGIRQ